MGFRKRLVEIKHIRTIDVHCHLGKGLPVAPLSPTIQDVIEIMKENEIDQAIPSPIPGFEIPKGVRSTQLLNNYIADAVRKYPKFFPCGLGTVELRHGEGVLKEVDRVLNKLKLKGLAWHHLFHGIPIDHPLMFPIMERLAKEKAVAFIHTSPDNDLEAPVRLEVLVEHFPDVIFINAHPAMGHAQLISSIRMARRFDNVYLDTCLVHHVARTMERMIKEAGADRVMFGSDLGYYDISIDLFNLITAKISEEEREMVLWKNAARVFGLAS